jgi:hypothetical protein
MKQDEMGVACSTSGRLENGVQNVKTPLENPGVAGWKLIEIVLEKKVVRVWTGFICFKIFCL